MEPTPDGRSAFLNIITSLVRVATANIAGYLIMQLARLGIDVDSATMVLAVHFAITSAYFTAARWLEERGKATRLLAIKQVPVYVPPSSK